VRSITIREMAEIVVDTHGDLQDRVVRLTAEPSFESGDQLNLTVERRRELLEDPFALRPELVVPAGRYDNTGWSIALETARKRPLWLEAVFARPGFFDGRRRQLGAEAGWTPNPLLAVSVGWERNEIVTPHGNLDTDLGILRLGLAASTRLRWDALVQYSGENDELSGNLRLHWIWSPGSDLYLVADLHREELGEETGASTRAVVIKLTRLVWF
jgi:hypothetical protein